MGRWVITIFPTDARGMLLEEGYAPAAPPEYSLGLPSSPGESSPAPFGDTATVGEVGEPGTAEPGLFRGADGGLHAIWGSRGDPRGTRDDGDRWVIE